MRSEAARTLPNATFPRVREWLTFTAERGYTHSVALVVGVVARGDGGALAPLLRPLGASSGLSAHFHAAAFSYRPLPRNPTDLPETLFSVFTRQTLLGVLHLLDDDRAIEGAGESDFLRGSFWTSPVTVEAPNGERP